MKAIALLGIKWDLVVDVTERIINPLMNIIYSLLGVTFAKIDFYCVFLELFLLSLFLSRLIEMIARTDFRFGLSTESF